MFRLSNIVASAIAVFLSSIAISANADIALILDTDAKSFALSGTDSGTIGSFGASAGIVQWATTLGGSGGGFVRSAAGDAFSVSPGAPNASATGYDTELNIDFSGVFRLTLFTTLSGAGTINGEEVFKDYSTLSLGAQARLESAIGQSIPLATGGSLSGFAPVSVIQGSAVPEPSSMILISSSGLFIFCRRRRLVSRAASRS